MAPRAVRTRQELVRDVADEDVRERELLLPLDQRARLAPDQVSPFELLEDAIDLGIGVESQERVVPEDLPDDGRVEEDRAVPWR
jgi:hypothetical protein